MLNSLDRFAAAAATPILLNLCLIAGAARPDARSSPTAGHALAWGVAAAGVAQFLWLAWVVRARRAGAAPAAGRA